MPATAARLVPIEATPRGKRIGIAKDKFAVPDDIDTDNAAIEALFEGTSP